MRLRNFTTLELMIVVAIIGIIAAIVVPQVIHTPQSSFKDGWTWVAKTQNGDDIIMKHFPEKHITIYSTWRGISVVKD